MTKTELLKQIESARLDWDALIERIDRNRMTMPGVEGTWCIKDILAHVTWFEREMVEMLHARALVGSDLWQLPQDERNAAIFEQNRDRPLDEVLRESKQVYRQLYDAVCTLTEAEANDPACFRDMPDDWVPWKIIAGNAFEHYPVHAASIRKWLASSRS
ncbi:MAG: ClbS/DfsB family four-helix bundle protein [Chloroflexota bacterium]|nr:ClbS/DfsB family four-helix bundle protein [Chloroflexota bacterium]